ncbi:hypothetical protein N658DRAFT_487159 [Parathielavia hyrcaniae]|uniref:Uncharacterized protein n=1 Tax=Parathielavia hyrcaniae TaxID=113614 RepID=A0AAN6SZY1_9PEZI|nr:hypothetical protein N658DRAFT_487159 [Parathielavia hyrcaniae]
MAGLDAVLDQPHRDFFDSALGNVFGTERALETYAQIVDGLPIASVAVDRYGSRHEKSLSHPIARHTSLCPGATEIPRAFLAQLTISGTLSFDDELLRAYQSTQPGSGRSFECCLIELVARAVHQIAVLLFQQGHCIHNDVWSTEDPAYTIDAVTAWRSERTPAHFRLDPTLFSHFAYGVVEQYPDGVADAVGYWAENRVLGGVVILDRSDSWHDEHQPEPNVFLHSDYARVTFRVWRALDKQQQSLVDFPLSGSSNTCSRASSSPLPLAASEKNLDRIDPEYATRRKVYRDIWSESRRAMSPRIVSATKDLSTRTVSVFGRVKETTSQMYIERHKDTRPIETAFTKSRCVAR